MDKSFILVYGASLASAPSEFSGPLRLCAPLIFSGFLHGSGEPVQQPLNPISKCVRIIILRPCDCLPEAFDRGCPVSGKTTISRTFFYLAFSLIIIFSLGGALYSINHEYQYYKHEVFMVRDHYIETIFMPVTTAI